MVEKCIFVGNGSGYGNQNSVFSGEEDPSGHPHSPMGSTINYNNVEVHIGLFGNLNIFDVYKNTFRPSASRSTAFLCAAALVIALASSTPTASRRELAEGIEWAEPANCSSEYCLKDKRRKL